MRKVFDTVNDVVLLDELERNGVRGIALEFFRYYLFDRKYHVSVNDVNSKAKTIYRLVFARSEIWDHCYCLCK